MQQLDWWRGLVRLWLVFASLWVILVVTNLWSNFERLPTENGVYQLEDGRQFTARDIREKAKKADAAKDTAAADRFREIAKSLDDGSAAYKGRVINTIVSLLQFGLGFPLAIFALMLALRWVLKGFSRP